jgi:hypothetical protein
MIMFLPLQWGAGPMALMLWLNWQHDYDDDEGVILLVYVSNEGIRAVQAST